MKHILLTLLACCMMAVGAQAQLTYKDSKYGWSVTLPKGWEIIQDSTKQQSSSGILDSDQSDEADKTTFSYDKRAAGITVSVTPTPDKYKGKVDELIKLKKKTLSKSFAKVNTGTMKMKTKTGSATIGGKKFTTVKVTLYMEKDRIADVVLYLWGNDEYQLILGCSTSPQNELLVTDTINDALQQISSSIQL